VKAGKGPRGEPFHGDREKKKKGERKETSPAIILWPSLVKGYAHTDPYNGGLGTGGKGERLERLLCLSGQARERKTEGGGPALLSLYGKKKGRAPR